MERLTNKKEADARRKQYEIRLASGYPRNIPEERFLKLAAYEDTWLEPEDFDALQKREQGLAELLVQVSCGCAVSYARLAELAQAEKDGRLVALPCKKGDTLWSYYDYPHKGISKIVVTAVSTINGITVINTDNYGVIPARDIGDTVFLTRAEAEAALKRRCR